MKVQVNFKKDQPISERIFKDVNYIQVFKEIKVMVLLGSTADNKIDLDEVSSFKILEG